MPRGASFVNDAPALAELAIQTGLHLNLTEQQPGSRFCRPLTGLIRQCYLRRVDRSMIQDEIEEQCDGFERLLGKRPDYVDGHQHVHQLPVVREVLLQVLQRRYGPALPWLRSTRAPRDIRLLRDGFKATLIETLGARPLQRAAKKAGFQTSRHLLGVYDFSGDKRQYLDRLDTWISMASPADVLVCHPASGVNAGDPLGHQREVEFAALADRSLTALLAKHRACIAGRAA